MNREITCPSCGGYGFFIRSETGDDYAKCWSVICEECRGSGSVIVPSQAPTRRERLNAMGDEEFAAWLIGIGFAEHAEFCGSKPECEELLERDEFVPAEWYTRCLAEWLGQEGEL